MVRAVALSLALMTFLSFPAPAHGPTRQKVTEKVEINAPVEKVWAAVGNFQDMSWHPAVTKTEGSGSNDAAAKRTLTLASGGKIEEVLMKHDAKAMSYSYEITNVDTAVLPVTNYSSTLSVKGDGGKTTVEWKGAFYRGFVNNDPPPELSDEAAVKAVTGFYKAGLDALKGKLEAGT